MTLYLGGLAHFLVVLDEVGVVSHHPRVGIAAQWQLVALHQLYTHVRRKEGPVSAFLTFCRQEVAVRNTYQAAGVCRTWLERPTAKASSAP